MKVLILAGGFGSWILEMGVNNEPIALANKVCGIVGSQDYLRNQNNLSINNLKNCLNR